MRDEQCRKVCRILDDVLANRATERDALIAAVRTAFDALKDRTGRWERTEDENGDFLCWECSECGERYVMPHHRASYCPNCGADMRGEEDV